LCLVLSSGAICTFSRGGSNPHVESYAAVKALLRKCTSDPPSEALRLGGVGFFEMCVDSLLGAFGTQGIYDV